MGTRPLVAVAALVLVASISVACSDTDSVAVSCVPATGAGDAIAEGLTVQGGGTLTDAQAVKFAEPIGNVNYAVAGEIGGPGLEDEGDIGVWAVGGPDGDGPIWALDAVAIEFSEWLADAQPGSPADRLRDEAAQSSAAGAAKDCVGG